MISRIFALLSLVSLAVNAAPVSLKVTQSGKTYASANLLAALKEEVASAAASEIDFFLSELGSKSSFLQWPVDAQRLKRGMYLSEPLRAPPQQVLNVIEKEPTFAIAQKAYYDGLEAKTAAMNLSFRKDLAKMRAGH